MNGPEPLERVETPPRRLDRKARLRIHDQVPDTPTSTALFNVAVRLRQEGSVVRGGLSVGSGAGIIGWPTVVAFLNRGTQAKDRQ